MSADFLILQITVCIYKCQKLLEVVSMVLHNQNNVTLIVCHKLMSMHTNTSKPHNVILIIHPGNTKSETGCHFQTKSGRHEFNSTYLDTWLCSDCSAPCGIFHRDVLNNHKAIHCDHCQNGYIHNGCIQTTNTLFMFLGLP